MSYNYFLQAHQHGQSQEISMDKLLAILDPYIVNRDENAIDLEFDNERCTIFIDSFQPTFSDMMTDACGHLVFLKCLYEIMQLGNFVFYEPDGIHIILVNQQALAHTPEHMTDIGTPVVATDFENFKTLFFHNR